MKNILILIITVLVFTSCDSLRLIPVEQQLPLNVATTMTKLEAYGCVREWYEDAFKLPDDAIQMDDKELGVITGKFTSYYYVSWGAGYTTMPYYFLIKTKIKEGFVTYQVIARNTEMPIKGIKSMQILTENLERNFITRIKECQNN